MYKYILKRLLWVAPLVLAVVTCVFAIVYLTPGDPARIIAGQEANLETVELIRTAYGFDQPVYVQYFKYLQRLFSLDLGRSTRTGGQVIEEVLVRFPYTLQLAGAGILLTVLIGIPVGVLSAIRHNTWLDHIAMFLTLLAASMPSFFIGLLLMLYLSAKFGIFPLVGAGTVMHLVLPAIAMSARSIAVVARLTRSEVLGVKSLDFVTTARSKGLTERVVIFKHALRNSLLPVVTVLGTQFGTQLGGAVVVERVFNWPGVGDQVVSAILSRDFPTVQAILLIVALSFILVNLLVDLTYSWLNPRIRYG